MPMERLQRPDVLKTTLPALRQPCHALRHTTVGGTDQSWLQDRLAKNLSARQPQQPVA